MRRCVENMRCLMLEFFGVYENFVKSGQVELTEILSMHGVWQLFSVRSNESQFTINTI